MPFVVHIRLGHQELLSFSCYHHDYHLGTKEQEEKKT